MICMYIVISYQLWWTFLSGSLPFHLFKFIITVYLLLANKLCALLATLIYSPNWRMYTFCSAVDVCSGAWQRRINRVRHYDKQLCRCALETTDERRRQTHHWIHYPDTRGWHHNLDNVRFGVKYIFITFYLNFVSYSFSSGECPLGNVPSVDVNLGHTLIRPYTQQNCFYHITVFRYRKWGNWGYRSSLSPEPIEPKLCMSN